MVYFVSYTKDYRYNLANCALVNNNYNLIKSFTERVHIDANEPTYN